MIIALESSFCLNSRSGPGGSFHPDKQSGANYVISLFNLNLIPKSNRLDFIPLVQLVCCSVMRCNSSLHLLF